VAPEPGPGNVSAAPIEPLLLEPADAAGLHTWLEANHATSGPVRLAIGNKGNSVTSLTYEEAIEEALAFGWIDSTAHALDGDRHTVLFSRRKPRSTWSRSNKERVERLIAQGRMMPAGIAAVETAKANGSWTSLDDVEALVVPEDLATALSADPAAGHGWEATSASQRKISLHWLQSAKRPETRARRVSEIVQAAIDGRKLW
jgi:uncharacterized protein YdeI (YjbR/CyaY-like superfamily)